MSATCLRFATVYGVGHRMRFDLTVNEFTRDLWADRKLDVFGETFWRPYVHVRDAARAVALVLASPLEKVAGRVFNAGHSDENYRKLDLVEIITGQLGRGDVEYVTKHRGPARLQGLLRAHQGRARLRAAAARADGHRGARRRARGGALRRPVLPPLLEHRLMSDAPLIPLFDVQLEQAHLDAVADTLRSGWLTMGPRTQEFERVFAEHLGCKHAIALANCTAALHLAYLAAGVGPGDEVIVPPITFVATAAAARYCGAEPVFADVKGTHDLGIDPEDVARTHHRPHQGGLRRALRRLRGRPGRAARRSARTPASR